MSGLTPKLSNAEAIAKLRAHRAKVLAATQEVSANVSQSERKRLMLDPSFLFSADAVEWLLDDPDARDGIVVPAAFADWLDGARSNADVAVFVAQDDREAYWARLGELAEILQEVAVFHDDEATLSPEDDEVRRALIEGGDTAARILAEEWTFLQSQSWAVSKLRHPLDAFRDAGAGVVEFGRKFRDELISVVVPERGAPDVLTPKFVAKVAAKWVIVGGASAGGTFLGPVGAAAGLLPIPIVRAVDP